MPFARVKMGKVYEIKIIFVPYKEIDKTYLYNKLLPNVFLQKFLENTSAVPPTRISSDVDSGVRHNSRIKTLSVPMHHCNTSLYHLNLFIFNDCEGMAD